jgi:hypothetical protein
MKKFDVITGNCCIGIVTVSDSLSDVYTGAGNRFANLFLHKKWC